MREKPIIIEHQLDDHGRYLSDIHPEATVHTLASCSPPKAVGDDVVGFNRMELQAIFGIYGRMVAQGIWKDYALDFSTSRAIFSVFRRNGEAAFYRIVKEAKSARQQGAYSVVAQTGLILKRGSELPRVLAVFEKKRVLSGI